MKNWTLKEVSASAKVSAFTCEGTVVFGDWLGDTSEPGCWQRLDPYVNDLRILVGDTDVTEFIEAGKDELFDAALIEAACEKLDGYQARRDDAARCQIMEDWR